MIRAAAVAVFLLGAVYLMLMIPLWLAVPAVASFGTSLLLCFPRATP